jgi:hypothetical protein
MEKPHSSNDLGKEEDDPLAFVAASSSRGSFSYRAALEKEQKGGTGTRFGQALEEGLLGLLGAATYSCASYKMRADNCLAQRRRPVHGQAGPTQEECNNLQLQYILCVGQRVRPALALDFHQCIQNSKRPEDQLQCTEKLARILDAIQQEAQKVQEEEHEKLMKNRRIQPRARQENSDRSENYANMTTKMNSNNSNNSDDKNADKKKDKSFFGSLFGFKNKNDNNEQNQNNQIPEYKEKEGEKEAVLTEAEVKAIGDCLLGDGQTVDLDCCIPRVCSAEHWQLATCLGLHDQNLVGCLPQANRTFYCWGRFLKRWTDYQAELKEEK